MKKKLILLPILLLSSSLLVAMNKAKINEKLIDSKIESEKLINESKKLRKEIKKDNKKYNEIDGHIKKSLELADKGLIEEAKEQLEKAKLILSEQRKKHIEVREKRFKDPKFKDQLRENYKEKYKNPAVDKELKKDEEKIKSLEAEIQKLSK